MSMLKHYQLKHAHGLTCIYGLLFLTERLEKIGQHVGWSISHETFSNIGSCWLGGATPEQRTDVKHIHVHGLWSNNTMMINVFDD